MLSVVAAGRKCTAQVHKLLTYTETGIIYGPYGAQREWTLHGPQGEDVSGAMRWAVDETKRIMRADADALIAKLRAAAI